ncbi:putative serine threonine-protein kinase ppk6 protein [Neofusicoccum parvum UCRNP2]|uniref:non-specific serine/threonine protein kinase n=1 Tax=Botryosphaeria parva (strain UCR-NP2) TaxID=1287680 RepID=R1EPZ9_BOTPV|nr:putative serine threonine-protein kinase ppk6 protein [Neofusicoccum parvum UCRNP2]
MCIFSAGSKPTSTTSPEQPPPQTPSSDIKLPKNKSTSNLLSQSASNPSLAVNTVRPRMSFDSGTSRDYDRLTRSPIVPEHEHGLGASGLRRIRQQPLRTNSSSANSRSASINLSLPPTRHPSTAATLASGPSSPTLNFSEDLSRFPSESLHSFSFAHQSEDFIYNRQNVLKRSIDFMRDKLGWAATNSGIANAQARLSGDQDIQSMMELLSRANLIGEEALQAHGLGGRGPVTGPADASGENIFEKSFAPRAPHGHGSRWAPAAQAIFTTEAQAPWTITAANDLACLVFGVTRSEVRKMGILEVVQKERRNWLEEKLRDPEAGSRKALDAQVQNAVPANTLNKMGNGITAKLLSKKPSHATGKKRSKTDDGSGSSIAARKNVKGGLNHQANKSRGVLLCGDVVPIQKRNGATGAASLWVKEKRGGLIWVLEEIAEDVVYVTVDEIGSVVKGQGAIEAIWGTERVRRGMDFARLIPEIPRVPGTNTGALDFDKIAELKTFTARTQNSINIPITLHQLSGESTFRVSSFPHIAGIVVLNADTLQVSSANTVFSSALFGQGKPEGLPVTELLPSFDKILHIMTEEDQVSLVDGIVIPEHSFRRARALLAMREGAEDAAAIFLRPSGLPAKHRDGAEVMVDVQMPPVQTPKEDGAATKKKTIDDFVVLEDMGQGAYGQVKLCRYKNGSRKMVIKYVTKRRILVDTWTRDRRLGTVPLEIHVLDYLRRDGFKHPNIVEMNDFFEDEVNYYIEMLPHGLPGMDLFDYIELRVNMDETECRKIFVQVAEALHHLHTKAKVVHRDIKDENVILDGEGNIKLIDFGSAAYIKNGPFDVFVGTIDYAAPEVLAGKSYRGKEQDVWALGILLYTIVYKENPFYSIDEIMDHDLRVPYIMSEESIDLIRLMLNRDVDQRITIGQVLEHPWCKMEGQGTG